MTITTSVTTGYDAARSLRGSVVMRGTSANAHHVDHAMCTLGMAAYWFETFAAGPESNDQNVGYLSSVSTKPMCSPASWRRRGGIRGKNVKPTSAIAVVTASVLR